MRSAWCVAPAQPAVAAVAVTDRFTIAEAGAVRPGSVRGRGAGRRVRTAAQGRIVEMAQGSRRECRADRRIAGLKARPNRPDRTVAPIRPGQGLPATPAKLTANRRQPPRSSHPATEPRPVSRLPPHPTRSRTHHHPPPNLTWRVTVNAVSLAAVRPTSSAPRQQPTTHAHAASSASPPPTSPEAPPKAARQKIHANEWSGPEEPDHRSMPVACVRRPSA
jgi:hypothetical protein